MLPLRHAWGLMIRSGTHVCEECSCSALYPELPPHRNLHVQFTHRMHTACTNMYVVEASHMAFEHW